MAYRNMVRDRVRDSFIKDAETPGIMQDVPPLEDRDPKRKRKKKPKMTDEMGTKAQTASLLDL